MTLIKKYRANAPLRSKTSLHRRRANRIHMKHILNLLILGFLAGCLPGGTIGVRQVEVGRVERNGSIYSGTLNSDSRSQNLGLGFSTFEVSRLRKQSCIIDIRIKNLSHQTIHLRRRLSPEMTRDSDTINSFYLLPGETGLAYRGLALRSGVYWSADDPSQITEEQKILIEVDGIKGAIHRRKIPVLTSRGAGP